MREEIVLLHFEQQHEGEEFNFPCPSRTTFCAWSPATVRCSETSIWCHAMTAVDEKCWYPLLLSTVTVGLDVHSKILAIHFQCDRRLLPVVSLKLPMTHSHPQVPAESGRTLERCCRSANEVPSLID